MKLDTHEAELLQVKMDSEKTQLSFYQCMTKKCPHYKIPRQIREFAATNKPCYPPAVLCDGYDGCEKEMERMKDTTLSE